MQHLLSLPRKAVPHFHSITGFPEDDWYIEPNLDERLAGSAGATHLMASHFKRKGAGKSWDAWLVSEKRMIIAGGEESNRLPAYASTGLSLLPVPVYRWSCGQRLNQRLIHLQTPLLEEILEASPDTLHTLVASSHVLITHKGPLPEIPEADIVCFGIWAAPERASQQELFFAPVDRPGNLAFLLRKPSAETIQQYVGKYYFTMNTGIWLFSTKACNWLMRSSGWDGERFKSGYPAPFDFYGSFSPVSGSPPQGIMETPEGLKVALVTLTGGQSYRFGTNRDLLMSNTLLQNQVVDQREIWHRKIKLHPSVFILNAPGSYQPGIKNKNIWIENSYVHEGWTLSGDHILTGIPFNSWEISLQKGVCLDFVNTEENGWIVRHYGFTDTLSGDPHLQPDRFMNETLPKWLENRKLTTSVNDFNPEGDIRSLPLFPEIYPGNDEVAFIRWLTDKKPDENEAFATRWLNGRRWSDTQLGESSYIAVLESQRRQNRHKCLPLIGLHHDSSVFYQLDLEDLAREFKVSGQSIPEGNLQEENSLRPVNRQIFLAYALKLKGMPWEESERKAFELLRQSVLETVRGQRQIPGLRLAEDQMTWARSPVRLDLAGGWSDTPPYCFQYGGQVVNVAVDLNGQPPLQCYVRRRPERNIVLRSIDLGSEETLSTYEDIRAYNAIGSAFSIPRAALALSGFVPEFCGKQYKDLATQLEDFGSGLEISILSAVPKGSGLGTSSILAATTLGALSETCGLGWSKLDIGRQTLALEQLLTTGGGWQDQFGGILEGIKFLDSQPGFDQVPVIRWMSDTLFTKPDHTERILLYYTGITRVAKTILNEIVRGMFLNSSERLHHLHAIREHGLNTFQNLQSNDVEKLARAVQRSWTLNQKLDAGTNTSEIQKIIDKINPWVSGLKLLGAGGGGFMMIIAKDAESAAIIRNTLTREPPNPRARFVSFSLSHQGLEVTKS